MKVKVSGRVLSHTSWGGVLVKVDGAKGWDEGDKVAHLPLTGDKLPPVGSHVSIEVEWMGGEW